jgi:uncharacterized protein YecE (DUF72 family)
MLGADSAAASLQCRPVEPDDAQPALFEAARVAPAAPSPRAVELASTLRQRYGDRLRLGTSSWHFPGWAGLVWDRPHAEPTLSRHGLPAYAAHPLLRTVSLDRAFYRPLAAAEYARLAAQTGANFRFVVKAPSLLCDASLRQPDSAKPMAPNPSFLDPALAASLCAQPAAAGLRDKLGTLVFQLSPLPPRWLDDEGELHRRLAAVWHAVRPLLPPTTVLAIELRDAALLTPALARHLREHGVRACLGLHDRLPAIDEQLPLQRAMWPGPLVCRWNLQRGQRYEQARANWAPFDALRAPDVATRTTLARVARATLDAGHTVDITINNKAEGSAPLSVIALAEALLGLE